MGRHCARDNCPFCGWHFTDMLDLGTKYHPNSPRFSVQCCSCKATGPDGRTRAEAEKKWNARTPQRLDRHGVEVMGMPDPRDLLLVKNVVQRRHRRRAEA